jgi:hypothetical protein
MSSPKLPQKLSMDQMQTKWASILNPILARPTLDSSMLQNVSLTNGANVINHKLGRNLQGWFPVRFHGSYAQLYDTQDTNQTPSLTLNLNASANVVVDLVVF